MMTSPPNANYLDTPPLCQKGHSLDSQRWVLEGTNILNIGCSFTTLDAIWLRTPKKTHRRHVWPRWKNNFSYKCEKINTTILLKGILKVGHANQEGVPWGDLAAFNGANLDRQKQIMLYPKAFKLNGSQAFLAPKWATCQSWCCLTITLPLLG